MVEEIYKIKNQFLDKMAADIDERGGIERVNVDEMYKLADIVKDMAEAEKACWEAEYYRAVTEAMDGRPGYSDGSGSTQGMQGQYGSVRGMGYAQGGSGGRSDGMSGYQRQRDSMGRFSSRRGYGMSGYPMEELKMQMQQASPQEREQMVQELRQMLGNQMQ